jgi:hypothetical protein
MDGAHLLVMHLGEKADLKACWGKRNRRGNYHKFIKKLKNKLERHRANADPECQPAYGRYRGWES